MGHKTRIMYVEYKGFESVGDARIGRVTFSKTGQTIYYNDKTLAKSKKAIYGNYVDVETGENYWVSGCKKDGMDPLFANKVEIDDDVREEYWIEIRNQPEMLKEKSVKFTPKYSK
jgi:hypothetical protein